MTEIPRGTPCEILAITPTEILREALREIFRESPDEHSTFLKEI